MWDKAEKENAASRQSRSKALLERSARKAIDRVLWTSNATEYNRQMLAESIADEIMRSN